MTSDDTRRGQDAKWREVGTGMQITVMCVFCHRRTTTLGGRMRGPLRKLFSCSACEEKRGKAS